MAREVECPLGYDVQRVLTLPLALVNQQECDRIQDTAEKKMEIARYIKPLPVGVLPIFQQERPGRRRRYVASPTNTPRYFRWSPNKTTLIGTIPMPPIAKPKSRCSISREDGIQIAIPRAMTAPEGARRRVLPGKLKSKTPNSGNDKRGLAPISDDEAVQASKDKEIRQPTPLAELGKKDFCFNKDVHPSVQTQKSEKDMNNLLFGESTRSLVLAETNASPFELGQIGDEGRLENITKFPILPTTAPTKDPKIPSKPTVDASKPTADVSKPTADVRKTMTRDKLDEPLPASPAKAPSGSTTLVETRDPVPTKQLAPVSLSESSNTSNWNENSFEFQELQREPEPKVIAQQVLRGNLLRKYLHFANIAKLLKDSEEHLRTKAVQMMNLKLEIGVSSRSMSVTPHGGTRKSVQEVGGKKARMSRKSTFVKKAGGAKGSQGSSPAVEVQNATQSVSNSSRDPQVMNKSSNDRKQTPIIDDFMAEWEDGTWEDEELDINGFHVDPNATQLLRICRQVIAKRAAYSHHQQHSSLIEVLEKSLVDSIYIHHNALLHRAVEQMNSQVQESIKGYLSTCDYTKTLNNLFADALEAEVQRKWKRAILLASACAVMDHSFVQANLLRARCCRRLGLWRQAIQDLGNVVTQHSSNCQVHLLRACLHAKSNNLDKALMDVNRTLALHPQYLEALLLRADIYQRKRSTAASLQDLTTALTLDPNCWRAYYDRGMMRLKAVEGDEDSLVYHWEHATYGQLLTSIIEDFLAAVKKGCTMVEVVEIVGDLAIRLYEFTGDPTIIKQMITSTSELLHHLSSGRQSSFVNQKEKSPDLDITCEEALRAALLVQRGRMHALLNDFVNAISNFDDAVVSDYRYAIAHMFRGAIASLQALDRDDSALNANIQHLNRCITIDPTVTGAYAVRGALLLHKLHFHSALQDFKAAVASDPTLSEVWLQIAMIYLNHYHDAAECIKACSNALTADSTLPRVLFIRAEAYSRQGNLLAALRDYNKIRMLQPTDSWAQLLSGKVLLKLRKPRPALYNFISFMESRASVEDKHQQSCHVLCGKAYNVLAHYRKAVEEFKHAVTLSPTSENLVLLSESLHSLGDTENSMKVSERVISIDPESDKGYIRRAQLLVSVGRLTEALVEYSKAIEISRKNSYVYYERGLVRKLLYLYWRNQYSVMHASSKKNEKRNPFCTAVPEINICERSLMEEEDESEVAGNNMKKFFAGTIADLSTSIRLLPLSAAAYVDRAEMYVIAEDFAKAFMDFDSAIERDRKYKRAHVNLGVLKCQFGSFASAIGDFDQAIKYDPVSGVAYFNRGVCYQRLSLWEQADASYSTCIELLSDSLRVNAYRNRAIVRCEIGNFTGALEDFEYVRQSEPGDDQVQSGIGLALLQLGRDEEAAECFTVYGKQNRDTYADSGNAYYNMAATQLSKVSKLKRREYLSKAIRFYVRAIRFQPNSIDLRLNIANCLRKMNEFTKAIDQCRMINRLDPFDHRSMNAQALALYDHRKYANAIESMNGAVRSCVASSSALRNIFHAFSGAEISRNAIEHKVVTSPVRQKKDERKSSLETSVSSEVSNMTVNGSARQTLSYYMLNRGIYFERLGNLDDARTNYMDAIHFDAMSTHAHVCLGSLAFLEKKYEDSIKRYKQALEVDSNCVVAIINLSVVYLVLSEWSEAVRYLNLAITKVPSCAYAYANRAIAMQRLGELSEAEEDISRAIKIIPTQHDFYLERANIIARQKRQRDALLDYSTALHLGYEGKL